MCLLTRTAFRCLRAGSRSSWPRTWRTTRSAPSAPRTRPLWQEGAEASRAEPIPTHVSLEDFNRLYFGVGPDNYGWYQGRFQERVAQVQAKSGLGFIRALKSSGAASESDFAQQLQKLETLEPGFEAWAASLIALRPAASPR